MHLLSVHFSVSLMYFQIMKQVCFPPYHQLMENRWTDHGKIPYYYVLDKFVGHDFPFNCLKPDIII